VAASVITSDVLRQVEEFFVGKAGEPQFGGGRFDLFFEGRRLGGRHAEG
jgi:hypothetical protein